MCVPHCFRLAAPQAEERLKLGEKRNGEAERKLRAGLEEERKRTSEKEQEIRELQAEVAKRKDAAVDLQVQQTSQNNEGVYSHALPLSSPSLPLPFPCRVPPSRSRALRCLP